MTTTTYDVRRIATATLLVVMVAVAGCGAAQPTARTPHVVRRSAGGKPEPTRPPTADPSRQPSHRPSHRPSRRPTQGPTRGATQGQDPAAAARTQLARLAVRPRPHGTRGYVRDAFGSDWVDTDANGCNQRDDVLLRDAVPGTTRVAPQGACDHDVLAGTWHDPYTGRTLHLTDLKELSQAEAIQIDHVVPLAEAWVSGAAGWDEDQRKAFANDLPELLAVDGPTNMSKGDGDPAAWRPRQGYQCTYARRWIAIKTTWRLAVDPSEVAALRQMLGYCR